MGRLGEPEPWLACIGLQTTVIEGVKILAYLDPACERQPEDSRLLAQDLFSRAGRVLERS